MKIPKLVDKSTDPRDEFEDIGAVVAEFGYGRLEHVADVRLADIIERQNNALVKGVLHRGDAAICYGESTSGKTFIALDLAWHLALGKPDWHGRKVKRCPVLYCALEGVDGFRKRMLAALAVHGDPGLWFARLDLPVTLVRADAGHAGMLKIVGAAGELAGKCGARAGLVVIDTAGRATAGNSQNDSADVLAFVEDRMGEIQKRTGAAVLVLHHTNRAGDIRGALDWRNPMDVVLQCVKADGDARACIGEKIKDETTGPLFNFVLRKVPLAEDADGVPVTSCVVEWRPESETPADRKESKPAARLRKAFEAVQARSGGDVLVRDVREALMAMVAIGQPDPAKAQKSKYNAWDKSLEAMPADLKIVGEHMRAVNEAEAEFDDITKDKISEAHTVH